MRISEEDATTRINASIPRSLRGEARDARVRRLRALHQEQYWPLFDRVLLGRDGAVWVQDYQPLVDGPDIWTKLEKSGRPVGRLVLPNDKQRSPQDVLSFSTSEVLVRWRDADGAPYFSIHRIEVMRD